MLDFNPNHVIANYHLGLIFFESGDYANAIPYFETTFKLDSKNLDAILYLTQSYLATGKSNEAKAIYEEALKLYEHPEIHHNLGVLYLKENEKTQALTHFEKTLLQQPENETARHMVNALTQQKPALTEPPPLNYIRDLFDQYADYYNSHMKETLNYQAPFLLRDAFSRVLKGKFKLFRTLDLGCGTGLCAIYFRDLAFDLIGVDISSKMLEKAKQLDTYDELHEKDILAYLSDPNLFPFDLIIASDVFCYFGELTPLFSKIAKVLTPNGYFCFTIESLESKESNDSENYNLNPTGRFTHAFQYIQNLTEQFGFKMLNDPKHTITLRKNRDSQILGNLFILQLPDSI